MKRLAIFLFLALLSASSLSAEKNAEVSLRFGAQESATKVVFESDDEFIRGANAVVSLTSVTVEFPSRFDLKRQNDFPYGVVKKERSVTITLKDAADVRTYKLVSPARLVVDIRKKTDAASKPEQKSVEPAKPAVVPKPPDSTMPPGGKSAAESTKPNAPVPQPAQKPGASPAQSAQKPSAPQQTAPMKKRIVVLDPGHGGYDTGVILQNVREKDLALDLAKDLGAALAKKGTTVFATRKADQSAALSDRAAFANTKNPDLLISLHFTTGTRPVIYTAVIDETGGDTAAKQYSQFSNQVRALERSRAAAKAIAEALKSEFTDGAIMRELPLPLLTSSGAPAVLIEFPRIPQSAPDLKAREKIISALVKGILYEQ